MNSPCRKDCPRRSATCHNIGECAEYTEFFQGQKNVYDSRKQNRIFEEYQKKKVRRLHAIHHQKGGT